MNNKMPFSDILINNVVLIGLILVVLLFSVSSENFFSIEGLKSILRQVVEIGIIAAPMALLMIAGSVDLSVGSIMGIVGVVAVPLMLQYGVAVGILGGMLFGGVAGILNGILISYVGLHPIVITLGTLTVWRGVAISILRGRIFIPPPSFQTIFKAELFGVRTEVYLLAAVFGTCWWVLHRHPFGRYLYAVGGNERTAFLMGIRVKQIRLIMHGVVGMAAGLSGLLYVSKFNGAVSTHGTGIEFPILTVVLLGGVAFSGGYGKISSVVASLFFIGVLKAGLVIVGISEFIQQMIVGATLIGAVTLNTVLDEFRKHMTYQ